MKFIAVLFITLIFSSTAMAISQEEAVERICMEVAGAGEVAMEIHQDGGDLGPLENFARNYEHEELRGMLVTTVTQVTRADRRRTAEDRAAAVDLYYHSVKDICLNLFAG